jgi:hypothetical protein
MNKLNVSLPISSLSLGQVSLNFLRELYNKKIDCAVFPVGNVDISPFSLTDDFKLWLQDGINNRYKKMDRKAATLKCWHLNGSEVLLSNKQILYTFHETDTLTTEELALIRHQDHVVFSSAYSKDIAIINGAENVSNAPLGVDPEIFDIEKKIMGNDTIHWALVGKAEMRKATQRIINQWCKLYGNNRKHMLSLLINNPFFSKEQNEAILNGSFGGPKPFNVNPLPFLKTNREVNMLLNSIDVDLSGLSMGEGYGLPSFNATAIGKWSVVNHVTGHKDWANEQNAVILKPSSKIPCYDGVFFAPNQPFNQGNFWNYTDEEMVDAMKRAEKVAKTVNVEGKKLCQTHTYAKTVETILSKI